MANGELQQTQVRAPDGSIITVSHPKDASQNDILGFATAEFYKTHPRPPAIGEPGGEIDLTDVASQIDPAEFAAAVPRGMVKGVAAVAAPLARATQAEMSEVPSAPGVEETTEALGGAISSASRGYIPMEKPTTPSGRAGERVGEFLGDIPSWIGPGGPIRKAVTATLGGIGSYIGEQTFGAPGAFVGGALGGGLGGFGTGAAGLPGRVPKAIREKTGEEALRSESKEGYRQLEAMNWLLPPDQAGVIKRAIQSELVTGERQFRPNDIPGVWARLDELTIPYGRPQTGQVTMMDVERVRQGLNTERMKGGMEALAASDAISVLDELALNLPGVAGVTEQARKNWAAYKRGQIVEETIRRGVERAATTGKGANVDNAIRQEFRKLRDRTRGKNMFTPAEEEQIDLITKPGRAVNLARWVSSFSPRHPITGAIGFFGTGYATGDPLSQLALLGSGEIAHRYATRMTTGRAERLLETTRARAPASGYPGPDYYTPRPATPARLRAGYGAARALGATALSPETTELLELPEIKVTPQ
jgi:hypothetical protein